MRHRTGHAVVTGAAGLVGQNLILKLKDRGFNQITAIDKHPSNNAILRRLHPDINLVEADLAHDEGWQRTLSGCNALISAHAQIGGTNLNPYIANNITATERLIAAAQSASVPYLVHISSSAVNSSVNDYYTETKRAQEKIVLEGALPCVVLRPTLMFGWFDRKHLGWLARFMRRAPVFPIPGKGQFRRQPLFVADFCDIIISCMNRRLTGTFSISGLEEIAYIDLIRTIRDTIGINRPVIKVPYWMFWLSLMTYSQMSKNPRFTTNQLRALATPDMFEVTEWPSIFGVHPTPLQEALQQTLLDPRYSDVMLNF